MNQLIPITQTPDGVDAVMGRDLHEFLEVRTAYKDWFPRMVEYGFSEGQDFALIFEREQDRLGRRREIMNHIVSLDMAKQIAMVQRTERGRQARLYFIEVEKRYRAKARIDPMQLTRAEILQIALNAEEERLALESKNKALAPKAEAYDTFIDATGYYSMGAVAKMLGKGRQWLFRELTNQGVLIPKGSMRNTPYQKYMHHFVVKAHDYQRSNGEYGTSYTTYVQPSGINFIRRKLQLLSIDPLSL
ncbi:MAG: phage antirepressor KilAC domain-containing protein [Corynebacterium sp.]|nr:phage antirepressor KilAC domain-containing protein [Corynebacterium sp.]